MKKILGVIGLLLAALVILVIVLGLTFPQVSDQLTKFMVKEGPWMTVTPSPTPVYSANPTLKPVGACRSYIVTEASNSKIIISAYDNTLLRYKDEIIYADNNEPKFKTYNIVTNEKKDLLTVAEKKKDYFRADSKMYLYGDKLYLSVGGYFQPGEFYMIDLAGDRNAKLLSSTSNARIERIDNETYLVGGNGDGCGGEQEFAKIDTTTGEVSQPFLKLGLGCVPGDEIVGRVPGTWIIANHTTLEATKNAPSNGQKYTDMRRIVLSNPFSQDIFLPKERMPADVTSIVYNKKTFVLISEKMINNFPDEPYKSEMKIYEFDPSANSIEEKVTTQVPQCDPKVHKDNMLCLACSEENGVSEVMVNLSDKTVNKKNMSENQTACAGFEDKYPPPPNTIKTYKDIEKNLNLPSNLRLNCVGKY